jgi:ABC-type glycerol-3-phosphate transport system substrate-binding protein
LRAAGITPIGEGSSDRTFKIGIPIINSIFRFAGPEKTLQLLRGEITFTDPDVVQALTFWKQVVDVPGYDRQKALDLTLLDGIFEVTDGNAAIGFCGTYFYGKYGTTARDQGQIGILDWFTVEQGKGNTFYEISWAAGYGINQNSQQLEAAKHFLEYLMSPAAGSLWIKYVQSPYPVMPEEILPDSLYGMLATQRTGQQPAPESFTYAPWPSEAAQQMWEDVVRRFITGEHTVDLLIDRMNSRLQ